jgi:hypothetical protein
MDGQKRYLVDATGYRAAIPCAGVYHVRTSLSRIMNFTGYFRLLLYISDDS